MLFIVIEANLIKPLILELDLPNISLPLNYKLYVAKICGY